MCNLFTMELNLIVCNVTIKQLRNKVFDNMCDLFILEFNIFVRNVVIRQLGNKTINNICNLFTMELNIVVCNVTIRQLRNKDFNSITIGYARYRVCTCFFWNIHFPRFIYTGIYLTDRNNNQNISLTQKLIRIIFCYKFCE